MSSSQKPTGTNSFRNCNDPEYTGTRSWACGESKKLKTREQIAGEAMRLFVTRGFDHVTVAEVADAAGVSEKTVFNYFPTKEDCSSTRCPSGGVRLSMRSGTVNRA